MRIPLASPSQAIAGGAIVGAITGGPIGLAALGGLAAVAANEYLAGRRGEAAGGVDPETVGRPPGYVLQALERQARAGGSASPQPDGTGVTDGTTGTAEEPNG